ncbi:MAG TPA: transposase [Acidobacteriaceae bacterium]
MTMCVRQWPPLPARSPNATPNTKGAEQPTSSLGWNPRLEGISAWRRRTVQGRNSPKAVEAIVRRYPAAQTIHLVMDNLNIHCRKTLSDYFGLDYGSQIWNHLTVHYTPKHGSWLNQAEIEISLFSRQCLGQRGISNLGTLRREINAWNKRMNRDRVKINWQFTRQKARLKFGYKTNRSKRSKT